MLTQLITKLFTGEAGIFVARLQRLFLVYALLGLCAIGFVGFLLGALFVWLSGIYGTLATTLGFAGVCFLLVVGLYIALMVVRRPPRHRASDRLQRDIASIASVAAVSNVPLILSVLRRRKAYLLMLPLAGVGLWGALRGFARTRDTDG